MISYLKHSKKIITTVYLFYQQTIKCNSKKNTILKEFKRLNTSTSEKILINIKFSISVTMFTINS